jgi:hypothetical protein
MSPRASAVINRLRCRTVVLIRKEYRLTVLEVYVAISELMCTAMSNVTSLQLYQRCHGQWNAVQT